MGKAFPTVQYSGKLLHLSKHKEGDQMKLSP